jgi:hypothetical protein
MVLIKSILILFFLSVLTACVNLPVSNVGSFGQYGIAYSSNKPFMQMDYVTAETCGIAMNDKSKLDTSAHKALSSGQVRLACEKESLGELLPYRATVKVIATDELLEARFITESACKAIFKEMQKGNSLAIFSCPERTSYLYQTDKMLGQFGFQFEFQNEAECNNSEFKTPSSKCSPTSTKEALPKAGYIQYKSDGKRINFRVSTKSDCRAFDLGSFLNKSSYTVHCANLFPKQ